MSEVRYSIQFGSWPGEPHPDGEFFARVARQVEELGFDGIYQGDHLVIESPIPECLLTLSNYAAVTSRIKLGPLVLLLALRPLIATAKQLATLDVLSAGRLSLGIGVGGEFKHEWQACGVPTEDRGRRTDAYLEALGPLLRGESVSADNQFLSFEDVRINPCGVQPDGPELWIGGRSDAALRRAVRHGGWIAYSESVRGFAEKRQALVEMLDGGDAEQFRFGYMIFAHVGDTRESALETLTPVLAERYGEYFTTYIDAFCAAGTSEEVEARIGEYVAAGANHVVIYPQCRSEEAEEQLERLAALPSVAAALASPA